MECNYSQEFQNKGPGCANTVRGVIRLHDANKNVLSSKEWSLNASRVLIVWESFVVEGCCFTRPDAEKAASYTADVFWNDVRCPG